MKKILFPTDFSETANNAFVYALEMAKFMDAELIVLHVYELPAVSFEGYAPHVAEVYETIELYKFENFKDYIPLLRKIAEDHQLGAIPMSHVLENGDLVATIKQLAQKEKIDLIVMGTNGASGWKETFFGSNSGAVIEKVPVLSLSIPIQSKFRKIETIGFMTRFKDTDCLALKQVIDFAKKVNAKVKCLYVQTLDSNIKTSEIERWREDFRNEPVEFFIILNDAIKETIFHFLDTEDIDILAMLTYKRSFLESLFHHSLTQKLSYHCEIPILAFHEKESDNISNF